MTLWSEPCYELSRGIRLLSLFRLGGLQTSGGRKKKSETAQPAAPADGNMVPAVQIEFTTELTKLAAGGFDDSVFGVPAGFKQVDDRRMR